MSAQTLSEAERRDWLRLLKSENVGPSTFRMLIERFGSAADALAALPGLSRNGGLGRSIRLCSAEEAQADLDNAAAAGARYVAAGELGYPSLLDHIDGAPPLLCVKGNAALAGREAIAIVGSRNASASGRRLARMLAAELAAAGYLIVSGLARGIDTAAHEAALPLGTAAVLAGGIDVVYPPENAGLHESIGRDGMLISEMPPGTAPRAELFPRRNRLISGICRAVIVVEAALRSGSLITARLANEQGREVFAVPGSPLDPRCEGTNKLIRDGAHLLTKAEDVIDALAAMVRPAENNVFLAPPNTGLEIANTVPITDASLRVRIFALLSHSPIEIDDLIRESGAPAALVLGVLLELELAGKISRHGRQLVSLA